MVLEIIRIFDGSFEGNVLYNNPNYVSPNTIRRNMKKIGSDKYVKRKSDILVFLFYCNLYFQFLFVVFPLYKQSAIFSKF